MHLHTPPLTPILVVVALFITASARDITFPPIAAVHRDGNTYEYNDQASIPGASISGSEDVLASAAKYQGLTTWGNLPYVHCLAGKNDDSNVEPFDIAILGAPFDTVCPFQKLRGYTTG